MTQEITEQLQEAIVEGNPIEARPDHHDHAHSDTVQVPIFGEVTVVGGIYTVIFGVLALLTLIEVIVAETLVSNPDFDLIRIVVNISLALGKSALVIWFYMHLNRDNRLFLLVLLVPTFIVLLSVLFLASLPSGAGMGYS